MPTTYSDNTERIFDNTQVLTDDITLTPADSGKVFYLNAAAAGDVTLPAPHLGFNLKFIIGATNPTTAWQIIGATAAVIQGSVVVDGAAVPAVNMDQVNFVASTAVKGDFIEIRSDGTNYYLSGVGEAAGSITAST